MTPFWQRMLWLSGLFFVVYSLFFSSQVRVNPPKATATKSAFRFLNKHSQFPEYAPIDSLFEQFIRRHQIHGLAVAIAKDSRMVYARGFGFAHAEWELKTEPYHLFRIASVSKLITAVAIMQLVEQKKLKLEDNVFDNGKNQGILPIQDYEYPKDERFFDITVYHLLTHTAGWWNELRSDPIFRTVEIAQRMHTEPPANLETIIRFMLRQKLIANPGTFYDYSNFGYCLLGKIIEQITKQSYEQYVTEHIFEPLGIHHIKAGKNLYAHRHPDEVKYYTQDTAKRLSIYHPDQLASKAYEGTNIEVMLPAGGWIANAPDLLKFLLAIDLLPQRKDILQPSTIRQMTTPLKKDSTHIAGLLGWKSADSLRWVRSGSLASTQAQTVRQCNGFTWVVLTNTGAWTGPYFNYQIDALIQQVLNSPVKWYGKDLFDLEHTQ